MKKLKWYNYVAKAILIAITIPVFPLLAIIGMASGGGPFELYTIMWKDR